MNISLVLVSEMSPSKSKKLIKIKFTFKKKIKPIVDFLTLDLNEVQI